MFRAGPVVRITLRSSHVCHGYYSTEAMSSVSLRRHFLFNSELRGAVVFVPGLAGLVLQIVTVLLTAFLLTAFLLTTWPSILLSGFCLSASNHAGADPAGQRSYPGPILCQHPACAHRSRRRVAVDLGVRRSRCRPTPRFYFRSAPFASEGGSTNEPPGWNASEPHVHFEAERVPFRRR